MPEKRIVDKAKRDLRRGKRPTTAAGELVREEVRHVREGKHGARSPEQAIAIGLSKARRAGVPLPPPPNGRGDGRRRVTGSRRSRAAGPARAQSTRRARAQRAMANRAQATGKRGPSKKRAAAMLGVLDREPRTSASRSALAKQARRAARRRGPAERSAAARRGARTKSPAERRQAARKAARTRRRDQNG
ncbi:MAG: transcription elongation factor [Deltaproteobacteria bacterium]|nr:transcription elongation factor [Deltaproteobacteria bacterium]